MDAASTGQLLYEASGSLPHGRNTLPTVLPGLECLEIQTARSSHLLSCDIRWNRGWQETTNIDQEDLMATGADEIGDVGVFFPFGIKCSEDGDGVHGVNGVTIKAASSVMARKRVPDMITCLADKRSVRT